MIHNNTIRKGVDNKELHIDICLLGPVELNCAFAAVDSIGSHRMHHSPCFCVCIRVVVLESSCI